MFQGKTRTRSLSLLLAPCLVVFVLAIVFLVNGILPFGSASLMTKDARFQYRYLFGYYRDVLLGKSSLDYSLTLGLGQTGIGVFAYYLMSPLNLLVLLFPKSNINIAFSILVVIKLALAAFSMAFYLENRFRKKIPESITTLLAFSWGLMQYSLEQCDNIMWLDGVILLPLMLWGVYRVVSSRKIAFLSLITGFSIAVQWYTAGINCVFSCFWIVAEILLGSSGKKWTDVMKGIGCFVTAMALGVMISGAVFFPAVRALQTGKGGRLDWGLLVSRMRGNPLSAIAGYAIGANSSEQSVSLFAGSVCLCGLLSAVFHAGKEKAKWIYGGILIFSVALFYWQPFFGLFSLMKNATSYWYRYAYVGIFALVFIAASGFAEKRSAGFPLILKTLVFVTIAYVVRVVFIFKDDGNPAYTALAALLMSSCLVWCFRSAGRSRRLALCLLACLATAEGYMNADIILKRNLSSDADQYQNYTEQLEDRLEQLHAWDPDEFRISSTMPFTEERGVITPYYLELTGFGEKGVSTYSSCPDYTYMNFLHLLGYRLEGYCAQIVNTSIVPTDSLLGVKYILSKYEIPGYIPVENIQEFYGKRVYYNPYHLPLAVKFRELDSPKYTNTFDYVNQLYRQLSGKSQPVFVPMIVSTEETPEGIRWNLTRTKTSGAVYGDLRWQKQDQVSLNVNDQVKQAYCRWLSPSVFDIPMDGGTGFVELKTEAPERYQSPQFYECDPEALEQAVQAVRRNSEAVSTELFSSGHMEFSVTAEAGEQLLVSVPANEGWRAFLNDEEVGVDKFEKALIQIRLKEGENRVVLKYSMPGKKKGLALSFLGLSGLLMFCFLQRFFRRSGRKSFPS